MSKLQGAGHNSPERHHAKGYGQPCGHCVLRQAYNHILMTRIGDDLRLHISVPENNLASVAPTIVRCREMRINS